MAPFAGGEAAGFGIAQIYLLGVNHTAAPGISVIFSAAVRRNPNHDASSRVGYIGQSTAGILRLFGGLLGCGDLGGSLGSPSRIDLLLIAGQLVRQSMDGVSAGLDIIDQSLPQRQIYYRCRRQ